MRFFNQNIFVYATSHTNTNTNIEQRTLLHSVNFVYCLPRTKYIGLFIQFVFNSI